MKILAICTRTGVIAGAVALFTATAFAQQPGGFQPAPPPMQLQQPVQAQPVPPAAYQPAPAPVQLQQPVQAQKAPPPPPPPGQAPPQGAQPDAVAQDQIAGQPGEAGLQTVPESGIIDAESSARNGVELSVEALAAAPYLHYDNGKSPGAGRVAPPKEREMFQRFDRVTVKPIGKELPFKTGDTVDVLRLVKRVKVGGERARLVVRTARGIVVGFAGKNAVVLLTDMWGTVTGSERVAQAVPFIPVYIDDKPASLADVKARVVLHLDRSVAPFMLQYIVIDKGSEAGVKLGDFFKVMDRERHNRLSEKLVEAQVLNVTAKASTLVLQKVYRERLNFRDEAYLSYRAATK
jgi:hypothetical protein